MDIKELFKLMVESEASDLFLKVGSPVHLRVDGLLKPLGSIILTQNDMKKIADTVLDEEQKKRYEEDLEVDFVIDFEKLGRFRGSTFHQNRLPGMVFRHIRKEIRTFDELSLPSKVLSQLSSEKRGLILITGATGSGKSTTIASMIEYINQNSPSHIVTIEDPVEFTFEDKKSLIEQRELGMDTPSYLDALKHIMYQSPDVIFIGNIRDRETMSAAMNAAETGQLVLSTIHSINTTQTVERIVNFFPPYQHQEVRIQLSLLLKGVISQRLISRAVGGGRIPSCEVMLLTPTIAALIREGKTNEIINYIEDGNVFGMETFDQCLARLCKENKITIQEARKFCDSVEVLDLALKGIKRTERGLK